MRGCRIPATRRKVAITGGRSMKRTLLLTAILAVGSVLALAGTASAQQVASVSIKPTGKVVGSGEAAVVRLQVVCEPPYEPLEANLSLSQSSASGFTGFGGFSCDGKVHKLRVTVPADEGTSFQDGEAFASAFVLVIHPVTQETQQGQASRTITLH
jgi:hypothetical protein